MFFLTLLLNVFLSVPTGGNSVNLEFTFRRMQTGKPPLKMFYYDVSIQNTSSQKKYVGIPRWFEEKMLPEDKIWGAQYDTFDKISGSTLFSGTSFTVFTLQPGQKIELKDFKIEIMSDDILQEENIELPVRVSDDFVVGGLALTDFMKREDIQDDEHVYVFKNSTLMDVQLMLK